MKIITVLLVVSLALSVSVFAQEKTDEYEGRYKVENLMVKTFFEDQQGGLTRYADNELVKIDTATGRVWKWVSERTRDKRQMREYWLELTANTTPMNEGAR